MNICFGKSGSIACLTAIVLTMSGCLSGSEVDDPNLVAPSPPPPAGNSAPVIQGNPPPAVVVGQNYEFTPIASDADGDTLTFSIENRPSWASFDPATGTLSGVANLGMEGNYPNIRISVSDGQASVSTNIFSIEVTQVALGSATLSWTAPTQNTDQSPLVNLAAYKIYYGTSPGSYSNQVLVSNPGLTTFVVDNLVPDTYYFVATAINSVGIESAFSGMASTTVTAN